MKCCSFLLWISTVFVVISSELTISLNSGFGDLNTEGFIGTEEQFGSDELSLRTYSEDIVRRNLVFHYFKNGNKTFEDIGLEANLPATGCLPTDKFAFIIHGWGQDCKMEWIQRLRQKLTERRGGCIVCVDYSYYKNDSYLRLLRFFRPMTNIVTSKLQQLKTQGFDPTRGFIFGFSLGGQMATAVGRLFGPMLIKQIDTCDMAGPGFDFRLALNQRDSAERVNCWHTSRNKGTRFYTCHQNVRFGNCGHNQPGESAHMTSHGLCVEYYINSFDYPFYAALQPNRCVSRNPTLILPNNYTVGYNEYTKSNISGEVFVPTSERFPYNLPLDQVKLLNSLSISNSLLEASAPRRPIRRRFPLIVQIARNRLIQRIGY